MHTFRLKLLLLLLALPTCVAAQPKATLKWLLPKLDLGNPTQVRLRLTHPPGMTVALPDTAGAFAPYEYIGVARQTVKSEGGMTVRETDFILTSFEVTKRQPLQLTLTYRSGEGPPAQDTTNTTYISFTERIPEVKAGMSYRGLYDLMPIEQPPSRTLFVWIGVLALAVLTLAAWFLRRPAARAWRRYRLSREWRAFRAALTDIQNPDDATLLARVNRLWKAYLDAARPPGELPYVLTSLTADEFTDWAAAHVHHLDVQTLEALCRAEEEVWFARRPVSKQHLRALLDKLPILLETEYRRRRAAA